MNDGKSNQPNAARHAMGLLRVYATIMQELKATGILRSNNNPAADFAEFLFAEAFDWQLTQKSTKGHDATDSSGVRYEIKARRMVQKNGSRQLSAIRDIQGRHFDFLAGVLFDSDFSVYRAALVPWEVVCQNAAHVQSTNSARFMLTDLIWEIDGVQDVTEHLKNHLADKS